MKLEYPSNYSSFQKGALSNRNVTRFTFFKIKKPPSKHLTYKGALKKLLI